MVKGLARLNAVGAIAMRAKYVDTNPCTMQVSYSPMTGKFVARREGFEPPTARVEAGYSIQLS